MAVGKRGAFYNTLEEFHKYWDRIDIICPNPRRDLIPTGVNVRLSSLEVGPRGRGPLFDNVFLHPSPWPLWRQSQWIYKKGKEIFKEQKFDLTTVHEYPPFYNGIGARMLWCKTKAPYILEIHHIPGYPKAADGKEKFYRNLVKMFIKYDAAKARAVRTVNQNQVPDFLKRAGVPSEKIKFISSLYIDLEVFKPVVMEKKYDLIFVGRLVKNKGINLFLEAVKKSGLSAIIVGDGLLRKKVELEAGNQPTTNNQQLITIFGWAKDSAEVARLLNESKILVMPSYNEGGPRVVAEAMACGVPVLATPVGIVPDVIQGAGEIIDWSAEDIARKAGNLLADGERYSCYSQTGPDIAKSFERKMAIKNYADKLKELIN